MSPATYKLLADSLVLIHFVFVVFVVVGAVPSLRWRWVPIVHLPAVAWAVFAMGTNRICPLTPLENDLREKAGEVAYAGGFVEHYITPVLYPRGLTDEAQTLIAVGVLLLNLACYSLLIWRRLRGRRWKPGSDNSSNDAATASRTAGKQRA